LNENHDFAVRAEAFDAIGHPTRIRITQALGQAIATAAKESARTVYEKTPFVTVSSGATGPMYLFKAPCVAIGGGYPFARAHVPNENVRLDLFARGMKWVANTVNRFSRS
jgi:acetylornithine deacetylase/succinyl-diaminopimelate desuccinylase-like protein